jgi:hypothetical protein
VCERGEQFVLKAQIVDRGVWGLEPLVAPVSAGAARLGIVTGGEPYLGDVPEAEVIGCARPAHPRRDPAGIDRVAEHVRPQPATATARVVTNSLLSE